MIFFTLINTYVQMYAHHLVSNVVISIFHCLHLIFENNQVTLYMYGFFSLIFVSLRNVYENYLKLKVNNFLVLVLWYFSQPNINIWCPKTFAPYICVYSNQNRKEMGMYRLLHAAQEQYHFWYLLLCTSSMNLWKWTRCFLLTLQCW